MGKLFLKYKCEQLILQVVDDKIKNVTINNNFIFNNSTTVCIHYRVKNETKKRTVNVNAYI